MYMSMVNKETISDMINQHYKRYTSFIN